MPQREIIAPILPIMTVFLGILGAAIGSFLNVVVWRLPRGESLSHPGSHCPKCNHAIRPWENIPILSWLLLRARCSNCGLPISIRYPLVEAANAGLFLAVGWHVWHAAMPLSALVGYLFLAGALLAASLIDIEHFLIPDKVTFSGMIVAVLLAAAFPESRIGGSIVGLPGADQVITGGLLRLVPAIESFVVARAPLAAGLDAVLGMAVGYAMLLAVLEVGRRLWGHVRVRPDEPMEAILTKNGLRIESAEIDVSWEDLLSRRTDCFEGRAVDVSGVHDIVVPAGRDVPIIVRGDHVQIGDVTRTLESLGTVRVRLSRWTHPRAVMGYGDLKLLAMIGAFMGPDACLFVLMLGAFTGCSWGISRLLCGHGREPLPFGPFLAAGALVWLFFGQAFVLWYGRLLTPF